MSEELLPCPFCGSAAEQGNDYEKDSAACLNKNCAGSTVECLDSDWNTRANAGDWNAVREVIIMLRARGWVYISEAADKLAAALPESQRIKR